MVGKLWDIYQQLFAALGPQRWWPAESCCEVLVGAVLTQNTSWRNVERAIVNLKQAGVLQLQALTRMDESELAELIRPAGYFRLKARRVQNLLRMIEDRYAGSLEAMFRVDVRLLRNQLLSVQGIGPETADAILLYGGQLPVFVVDAYTARIGARHGWLAAVADYDQIQQLFHSELPLDPQVYNEFHALLVHIGKNHCHKRQPDCASCPLREELPPEGPYGLQNPR
jgi:endonuclease-3 related protein